MSKNIVLLIQNYKRHFEQIEINGGFVPELTIPEDASYADSVNYIAAKRLGIKLLTGDRAFTGMENVEFVK